jgi:hypothetical protein
MKLFLKISVVTTLILFAVLYNREMNANEKVFAKLDFGSKTSSISQTKGIYRLDTAFIIANQNKGAMLVDLIKTDLEEKEKVLDIPAFIIKFLDSKTNGGHFFIGNKDEEWQTGFTANLSPVKVKMYDTRRKDSVLVTQLCCKKLPDKSLSYFGIGKEFAALAYYSGGRGTSENVILIKFMGEEITDVWYDRGNVFGTTKNDIIRFLKEQKGRGQVERDGC